MALRLKTKKIEKWIKKETVDGTAEFLVSPLSPREASDILKRCKNIFWEKGQRFDEPDYYAFKISKIKKTIRDWKGVQDEDGRDVQCTDNNKILIYEANPDFIDSVLDAADELSEAFAEGEAKEIENL